jgi:hypothetical protein
MLLDGTSEKLYRVQVLKQVFEPSPVMNPDLLTAIAAAF